MYSTIQLEIPLRSNLTVNINFGNKIKIIFDNENVQLNIVFLHRLIFNDYTHNL